MDTRNRLEAAAAAEAQAITDRARRQKPNPLEPLPVFSRASLRIVTTIDGMCGLVRYDADGNARMSQWGYLLIALAIVFAVAVLVGTVKTLTS